MWCQLGYANSNCMVISDLLIDRMRSQESSFVQQKLVWSFSTLFSVKNIRFFLYISNFWKTLFSQIASNQPDIDYKSYTFFHEFWFVFNIPSINCKTQLTLVPSL